MILILIKVNDFKITDDGLYLFVASSKLVALDQKVFQFPINTPWSMITATQTGEKSIQVQDNATDDITALEIMPDGERFWFMREDGTLDKLFQRSMGINVLGDSKFEGDLDVDGNQSVGGAQSVGGDITLGGNVTSPLIMRGRLQHEKGSGVTSDTDITLGTDGNHFVISGSASIETINSADWQQGSIVTLRTSAGPTIVDQSNAVSTTFTPIFLAGGVNHIMEPDDTLMLVLDNDWREISRTNA